MATSLVVEGVDSWLKGCEFESQHLKSLRRHKYVTWRHFGVTLQFSTSHLSSRDLLRHSYRHVTRIVASSWSVLALLIFSIHFEKSNENSHSPWMRNRNGNSNRIELATLFFQNGRPENGVIKFLQRSNKLLLNVATLFTLWPHLLKWLKCQCKELVVILR